MLRKIMLAMAVAAFVSTPAFAAVQNVKVSGNIDSSYIMRDRFDLGYGIAGTKYNQSFAMTQTQLQVDADLSDNVQTVLRLLNERAWGTDISNTAGAASTGQVDINLAYVRMKELLYSPLTVEIGRQQLNYGNAFVIGANGPNNAAVGNIAAFADDLTKATAIDAVKAILDYKPLTIDVFAGKLASNNLTGVTPHDDDVDLYGVNANYQLGDDMNTLVEAYLFSRIDHSTSSVAGATGGKSDTTYVPGLRASTNPISGLNVQGEVAWQRGTKVISAADNIQREAFGAQAIVNYQVKQADVEKYKPVLQAVYTFVSGDSNPTDAVSTSQASDNRWTAWDPMFEDQAGGKIYNALFSLSNAHILELSASANPIEDVTAKLSWTGIHLDKSLTRQIAAIGPTLGHGSATVTTLPDGTGAPASLITSNLDLGHEIDADLTYNYTEDVQIGVSLGYFKPGDAFEGDKAARQAIAHVGVNF
jgi:hypothetical protein